MQNYSAEDTIAVEPTQLLESIANELESLRDYTGINAPVGLLELHGALLLFALNGNAELIPTVRFPVGSHRLLQARIAWAARRQAGVGRGEAAALSAVERSAARIERLIHLIDPELRVRAA